MGFINFYAYTGLEVVNRGILSEGQKRTIEYNGDGKNTLQVIITYTEGKIEPHIITPSDNGNCELPPFRLY